eukprot:3884305-Amphidinium_carterae.2
MSGPTPQPGDAEHYISKYAKPFPPEAILHRQQVTIVRSGSDSQHMGQAANAGEDMPMNMDTFAEMQEPPRGDKADKCRVHGGEQDADA